MHRGARLVWTAKSLTGDEADLSTVSQVSQPSKVTGGFQLLPVAISLMSGVGE